MKFALAVLLCCHVLAEAQTGSSAGFEGKVRESLATAAYIPAYPSKLAENWKPWSKRVNEMIAVVAGEIENRAVAEDIIYEARRAGIEDALFFAMVEVLSRYDTYAQSSPRNQGLLQMDPVLVDRFGKRENTLFQAKFNLRLGATLFRLYLDQTHGDAFQALLHFLSEASPQRAPSEVTREILQRRDVRSPQLLRDQPASPLLSR